MYKELLPVVTALLILLYGLFSVRRIRFDLQKTSLIMTVCISFAVTALTFPYFLAKNQNLLFSVLASLRYGTQILGMNVNSEIIGSMNLSGGIRWIYVFLLYLLYTLGPVFASMFLLGFSRTIMEYFRFGRKKNVHVFSELNEKTIVTAETLFRRHQDGLRVFCDSDRASEALKTRARAAHAILVREDEISLRLRKGRSYHFYELYSDPGKTLLMTSKLISRIRKNKKSCSATIRTFINHSQLEVIKDIDEHLTAEHANVKIRYVDENAAEATELFHRVIPLLPIGTPGYHYEILIVGCGDCGASILRTAAWLMVLPESSYTIHVADRNARTIASALKAEAPEFLNAPLDCYFRNSSAEKNYDIVFHDLNVESTDFTELLSALKQPDLSVICTHDDILNHRIAKQIERFCPGSGKSSPLTAVRMRSGKTAELVKNESRFLYFGSLESRYSYSSLIHPELEEAAKVVHRSYYGSDEWTPEIEQTFFRYVNYDSSFAQALTMLARRRWILASKPDGVNPDDWIHQVLNDEEQLAALGYAEHDRWNAYQRISGWRCASLEETEAIARESDGKRVKSDRLLLHPAIVPGSELAAREQAVNAIRRKYWTDAPGVNYVQADRQIIACLPEILKSESIDGQKI